MSSPTIEGRTQKPTRVDAAFLPEQCLVLSTDTSIKDLAIGGACIVSMIESVGRAIGNGSEEIENLGNVITFLASITLGIFNSIEEAMPTQSTKGETDVS